MFSLLAVPFVGVSLCGYFSGLGTRSVPVASAMAGAFLANSAAAILLWSAEVRHPLFFVGIILLWCFSGGFSLGWLARPRKGTSEKDAIEVKR